MLRKCQFGGYWINKDKKIKAPKCVNNATHNYRVEQDANTGKPAQRYVCDTHLPLYTGNKSYGRKPAVYYKIQHGMKIFDEG